MIKKIIHVVIPHLIGFGLLILGWLLSIVNIGLQRFTAQGVFNKWTLFGLFMIIVGAYLPEVWTGIRNLIEKKKMDKTEEIDSAKK